MNTETYDIAIVGGGLNGAALALALSNSDYRIAMVDRYAFDAEHRPSFDDRAIALAHGSIRVLNDLGVWNRLKQSAAPIKEIHVSDRGHFGFTRLKAEQESVDALGHVATAQSIGSAIAGELKHSAKLDLYCPGSLKSFSCSDDGCTLTIKQDDGTRDINCRLLVAADGADSFVRKRLDIPVREWDYGQHAITANVRVDEKYSGVAYERFTDTGPLALLPMPDDRYAVVWTASDEQLASILTLSDQAFLQQLQHRFGYRLGRFHQVGRRNSYPLKMMQAQEHCRERCLIIGNAAHTVHPIAGQGFNLGLRDVATLASILTDGNRTDIDPGDQEILNRYVERRDRDQHRVTLATDILARLFSNPLPPLRFARNLGMVAIDLFPGAKHLLARQAMGLSGQNKGL